MIAIAVMIEILRIRSARCYRALGADGERVVGPAGLEPATRPL